MIPNDEGNRPLTCRFHLRPNKSERFSSCDVFQVLLFERRDGLGLVQNILGLCHSCRKLILAIVNRCLQSVSNLFEICGFLLSCLMFLLRSLISIMIYSPDFHIEEYEYNHDPEHLLAAVNLFNLASKSQKYCHGSQQGNALPRCWNMEHPISCLECGIDKS